MRRLLKKEERTTPFKRLIKISEWVDVDIHNPNLVQMLTDVMAAQGQVQIQYNDGQWRTVSPYGWNSSKEGNILLMCYKDTGEIRSYRLDKIEAIKFDSNIVNIENNQEEFNFNEMVPDNNENDLNNIEQDNNMNLPFEEELEILNEEDNEQQSNENEKENYQVNY